MPGDAAHAGDDVESLHGNRRRRPRRQLQELMQHAAIAERKPVAADLRPPVAERAKYQIDTVQSGRQPLLEPHRVEAGVEGKGVVGVHDEGVIDRLVLTQAGQRHGAVVGEILPRLVENLALQPHPCQPLPDDRLGAVRRSGILDQHVIDQRSDALQAAQDDARLVLDDHAKAECGHPDPRWFSARTEASLRLSGTAGRPNRVAATCARLRDPGVPRSMRQALCRPKCTGTGRPVLHAGEGSRAGSCPSDELWFL